MKGMIPLQDHSDMEALLRPRRPTEDGFLATYAPYVAISFGATWCGPCQHMDKASVVKATPQIQWYSVDVDENQVSLGYCGLRKIPSFCIIKDGLFIDKLEGASDAGHVLQWLHSRGFPVSIA